MRLRQKTCFGLPLLLWAMVLVYGITISVFSLTRLYEFKTSSVDLACYLQTFWNFSQRGTFVLSLPPPYFEHHVFGQHFTPFFYLIYPIYAIFPYAETFQLMQAWFYALAAIPVFLTARELGYSATSACIWAAIFLLNPFTLNASVWDFHETCFSTLVMSWLMWAIAAKKRTPMLAFALLLLSCKEHFGIAVAGAGLLWGIRTREWKIGASLFVFGLSACAVTILKIVPFFNPTGTHMMFSGSSATIDRFGWMLNPWENGEVIFALMFANLFYLFFLLVPVLGLPLRNFWWLFPAGADLAVNMLSGNGFLRSVGAYHTAPVIPVLVTAAAAGLASYKPRPKRLSHKELLGGTLIMTLLFGYSFAPLPLPGAANGWEIGAPKLAYTVQEQQAIAEIRNMIEPDMAVSLQGNIAVLFAKHRIAHTFPYAIENADLVVLRLRMPFERIRNYYGNPFTATGPEPLYDAYKDLLDSGQWHVAFVNAPWVVVKRGTGKESLRAQADALWHSFIAEYEAIENEALPF